MMSNLQSKIMSLITDFEQNKKLLVLVIVTNENGSKDTEH